MTENDFTLIEFKDLVKGKLDDRYKKYLKYFGKGIVKKVTWCHYCKKVKECFLIPEGILIDNNGKCETVSYFNCGECV